MPIRLRRLDSRHGKFRSFRINEDQPVDPARSWRTFTVDPLVECCLCPYCPSRLLDAHVVSRVGGNQGYPFIFQNASNFSGGGIFRNDFGFRGENKFQPFDLLPNYSSSLQ